ncbi:MAG: dihydrofolate reductase [Bacteroidota bacterium]
MILSIIVAMDRNRLIGKDDRLPWHLPADTRYFHNLVREKPTLMGRKSYESADTFLSNKTNVIISRRENLVLKENCLRAPNIPEALALLAQEEEAFVLGGVQIYRELLPKADRLYITHIDQVFTGNIYFPDIHWEDWLFIQESKFSADPENPYPYSFNVYHRKL